MVLPHLSSFDIYNPNGTITHGYVSIADPESAPGTNWADHIDLIIQD